MIFRFIKEDTGAPLGINTGPDVDVEMVLDGDPTIGELLEAFERFMVASGYGFDGHLDLVEDE